MLFLTALLRGCRHRASQLSSLSTFATSSAVLRNRKHVLFITKRRLVVVNIYFVFASLALAIFMALNAVLVTLAILL